MSIIEIAVTEPTVQAALVSAVGGIVSALIATVAAAFIGRQLAGRKRLQAALKEAVGDVQFLLAVEAAHCARHKEVSAESFKQRIRQVARDQGYEWSGKYTPGRARMLSVLNAD